MYIQWLYLLFTWWSLLSNLANWLTNRLLSDWLSDSVSVWLPILYVYCLTCDWLPIICYALWAIQGCTKLCPLLCIYLSRCYFAFTMCTFQICYLYLLFFSWVRAQTLWNYLSKEETASVSDEILIFVKF